MKGCSHLPDICNPRGNITYDSRGRNTVVKYHKANDTETLKTAYTYGINDQVMLMQEYEKNSVIPLQFCLTRTIFTVLKKENDHS